MQAIASSAALLAASLFAVGAVARDEAPAADPQAIEVIHELGLVESATAMRDMPGWKPPKKFVLTLMGPMEALEAAAPGVKFVVVNNAAEMAAQAADADGLFSGDNVLCDDRVLAAAKNARWFASYSAGVEGCLGKSFFDKPGVIFTNGRALSGPVMAEHTIAVTYALARNLDVFIPRQAKGGQIRNDPKDVQWQSMGGGTYGVKIQSMTGKTMLIAGLGGIGLEVAKRAHGLGMKVIATRASSHEGPDYVEYVGLSDELPTLISRADVVVSALPLIPATTKLFDAKMFARMKKTAFFINVGRGGSVVTDDLVKALQDGVIAGASVDVTEPEPLPPDHPLWKAPHVIITPHVSGQSELGVRSREIVLREQVRRYAAGDKLLSVVDLKKGY
ncbi:MAG: D-2-hydroxyacid dehydrogenase [Pseudomonadota bacterium]